MINGEIDFKDLVKAVSASAKAADKIGIPADKLIVYLVVTSKVTQKPLSIIGQNFAHIFENMADFKIEKLEDICPDNNIPGENLEIILDNVAEKWDSLSVLQKSVLADELVGTWKQADFCALMDNYEEVNRYLSADK